MIGSLPKTLTINDREVKIDTNFKTALLCMEVYNDPDLSNVEKAYLVLDFIVGLNNIDENEYEEALNKVNWFLDGGLNYENVSGKKKIMDWIQDEQFIFSAVNKVAGKETREESYIHWWTWLGYFTEINEGLFTTIVSIRSKKARQEKLTKAEQEFYKKNKSIVDINERLSAEEQAEIDRWNEILK